MMPATTHEQKVRIIRELYDEHGIGHINGMYAQLLLEGTDEARQQFEAAASDAGFEQDMTAPDHGHRILTVFGLAWRQTTDA